MTSIFSRIVHGEIPAAKVYEDDLTLAFMDINPASRGHLLVICKEESPDIFSVSEEALLATARTTQRVAHAIRKALQPDGLNILQNNGAAAGQVVFHYHVHIIPRWEGDGVLRAWRPHQAAPADLDQLAGQIRNALM